MDYQNLKIPKHVAIIMDGNGRWAQEKGLSRSMGHKEGAETLKKLCPYILSKGINVLSVFAFSTENFKRSKEEVDFLMNLFIDLFNKESKFLIDNKIKVVFSGTKQNLSDKIIKVMEKLENKTKDFNNGIFNVCLNYGGQLEIIDAVKKINIDVQNNKLDINKLDEASFNKYLYNDLPPIDLLIRTSGELRISNFMLWQSAYAEFAFPNIYFPDFNKEQFDKIILDYNKRDRRFGGINNEKKSH